MATDHFKAHSYQKGRADWNFNILVGKQPDVQRMANEYAPTLLAQAGLYGPVPADWLHMTILRIGLTDEFSEEEMLRVVGILAPKLANIQLSELAFDSWWQWGGNIVFHISPHEELASIYKAVVTSVEEVVGKDRTVLTPHGQFIPHVTLAYTKDRHDELATNEALSKTRVIPARFRAPAVALIRQWPVDGHYEWEVVREMPVGIN